MNERAWIQDLRRRLGDQRGSMLLVALMVLMALTSVGMLTVHLTNSEVGFAGNNRRGSTAFRVTESGAFTALTHALNLGPEGFVADVAAKTDETGKAIWTPSHLVSGISYFDMSATGSFGYEGEVLSKRATGKAPVDFQIQITKTGMRQPLVGYSGTGPESRCRFKYQFDAVGNVGDQLTDEPADGAFTVWQKIRSLMYVGPLPCDRAATGSGTI
jgi:hypothetical protein